MPAGRVVEPQRDEPRRARLFENNLVKAVPAPPTFRRKSGASYLVGGGFPRASLRSGHNQLTKALRGTMFPPETNCSNPSGGEGLSTWSVKRDLRAVMSS